MFQNKIILGIFIIIILSIFLILPSFAFNPSIQYTDRSLRNIGASRNNDSVMSTKIINTNEILNKTTFTKNEPKLKNNIGTIIEHGFCGDNKCSNSETKYNCLVDCASKKDITHCGITISEPYAIYELTTDIIAQPIEPCITIYASNVILDGKNHKILGTYNNNTHLWPTAIYFATYYQETTLNNITIKNFIFKDQNYILDASYNSSPQTNLTKYLDYNNIIFSNNTTENTTYTPTSFYSQLKIIANSYLGKIINNQFELDNITIKASNYNINISNNDLYFTGNNNNPPNFYIGPVSKLNDASQNIQNINYIKLQNNDFRIPANNYEHRFEIHPYNDIIDIYNNKFYRNIYIGQDLNAEKYNATVNLIENTTNTNDAWSNVKTIIYGNNITINANKNKIDAIKINILNTLSGNITKNELGAPNGNSIDINCKLNSTIKDLSIIENTFPGNLQLNISNAEKDILIKSNKSNNIFPINNTLNIHGKGPKQPFFKYLFEDNKFLAIKVLSEDISNPIKMYSTFKNNDVTYIFLDTIQNLTNSIFSSNNCQFIKILETGQQIYDLCNN